MISCGLKTMAIDTRVNVGTGSEKVVGLMNGILFTMADANPMFDFSAAMCEQLGTRSCLIILRLMTSSKKARKTVGIPRFADKSEFKHGCLFSSVKIQDSRPIGERHAG